ncbi:short chain dehydrogenase [Hymenobacter sp. GOD-10R]|uniref:short chain dehydrogenase n=1 Tax=Hymenobacter sp. GOD-10R TaxID=3093922 RepID=UPI002D781255|nr:short chain dehydrogenase [Hymenobacter sp. GOD-10R]WRQ26432.1 short chain dehydrogenase [Hymenobacter sp. GOD-10R]
MKIIIVGATGTIGKKVTAALENDHELVKVGSKSGDVQADITSSESIEAMYKQVGAFDALISTAGGAHFGPLASMTAADFQKGLNNKLLGQINLVLIGQQYINPKGSFTLSSGILSDDPVRNGANLTTVNAAINAFARAAAIELENGVRINAVSPGLVEDSAAMLPGFPGHALAKMDVVVRAYLKSVLGAQTGQVYPAV